MQQRQWVTSLLSRRVWVWTDLKTWWCTVLFRWSQWLARLTETWEVPGSNPRCRQYCFLFRPPIEWTPLTDITDKQTNKQSNGRVSLSVCLFVRSCLRWSLTRTAVVCRRVVLGNLSRTVRHWTTSKCEQGFAFCGCRFLPSQEPQRALTTVVHTDNGPAVPTRLLTDHTRPKRRRGVRLAPRDPAGARCQCTRYGDRKRTSDISNWTHLNTVEWRLMRKFSSTFSNVIVVSTTFFHLHATLYL